MEDARAPRRVRDSETDDENGGKKACMGIAATVSARCAKDIMTNYSALAAKEFKRIVECKQSCSAVGLF